jgi:hypothetical protein
MSRETNTLYPPNYVEPEPPEPPEDPGDVGRDFTRLRQLIRGAVPAGGDPMTMEQVRGIVYGRPSRNGETLTVGVSNNNAVRLAALETPPQTGIIPDSRVTSIKPREARAIWDEIIAEREADWTFQNGGEIE